MQVYLTYTKSGLPRYNIELSHDGLHRFRHIRGDSEYTVLQMAKAQLDQWDIVWKKQKASEQQQRARQLAAQDREAKKELAVQQTAEAQAELDDLANILATTLGIDDTIDWETLKDHTHFPESLPVKPLVLSKPTRPQDSQYPTQPQASDPDFKPRIGFFDWFSKSRRDARAVKAQQLYFLSYERWTQACKEVDAHNAKLAIDYKGSIQDWQASIDANQRSYEQTCAAWEMRRRAYVEKQEQSNAVIDGRRQQYLSGDAGAVLDYCNMVLSNSEYKGYFPKRWELDYIPETKIMVVDYWLPSPDDLPTLKEVKYIQARDSFDEKYLTEAQANTQYDSVLYQVILRTLHELFEADEADAIEAISINGIVTSVDKATGKEVTACILTAQVKKSEFVEINLANVDPKACFKKLKGVGSSKLHSLAPVAPILMIQKDDERFIEGYAVADKIESGYNLAIMDWEDFEHLVRELFEKEFSAGGGEVKVTRASRDRGVDAVVFDPDPIRGGKLVIQAKRYVGTVGVDAVRDLYGTVINEGAIKGILITTSDYGPDAYEFAREKPMTLLNGNNLLHMLSKHGYQARIDLKEAKQILGSQQE